MFPCDVRGDREKVDELLRLLDRFAPDFPLVLPMMPGSRHTKREMR